MSALQDCFFPLAETRHPTLGAQGPIASRLSGWMPCPSAHDLTPTDAQDEREAEILRLRAALEQKQHEVDVLAEALDYARSLLAETPAR